MAPQRARRLAFKDLPEPGLMGGIVPVAPLNRLSMLTDYIEPEERMVACPNQDVVYGAGSIGLDASPVVMQVPDFGKRFWVYQVVDSRTDSFADLGAMYGTRPGFYLLAGPGWKGKAPKGIAKVFRASTSTGFVIPRVFQDDTPEDKQAVQAVIGGIDMYPLAKYDGNMKRRDWAAQRKFPAQASGAAETKWVVPDKFFDELPAVLTKPPGQTVTWSIPCSSSATTGSRCRITGPRRTTAPRSARTTSPAPRSPNRTSSSDDARKQLEGARMQATLDLYPESETETVVIAGRTVPLEQEPSAALAWGLQEAPLWERELKGFFGSVFQVGAKNQLVSLTPHRYGQIPVVFVHGTASSAGRWAEMINVLQGDPAIRDRYDFWAFSYDTGNPIVYSSMILRDALTSAVKLLDPEGKDPGLKQMVVIGHSQGGLLTKMMVVNTGSQLYDAAFKKPIDQLKISDETREIVRRAMFVAALPFVKQVIFISTPHRGSYQAASEFVRSLLQRLVSTPARLVKGTAELLANREAFAVTQGGNRLPTAVDNMSPRNPFIKTLSIIPVDPGVTGKEAKSPRPGFTYFDDDGDLVALRYDNWKVVFMEQRFPGTLRVWAEPFVPLRVPKLFNLRTDPFERADITSNTYYDWFLYHPYIIFAAQSIVASFLATFKDYPPRQKAASFTIDQAMAKMSDAASGAGR